MAQYQLPPGTPSRVPDPNSRLTWKASALKRLLDQGWIERTPDPEGNDDGRGRKAYGLTLLGRQILEAEVQRLQGLLNAAQARAIGLSY